LKEFYSSEILVFGTEPKRKKNMKKRKKSSPFVIDLV